MTAKRFSNALGNISDGYVDEAIIYTAKKKKSTWVKWVSVAACLALIVMGGILGNVFHAPDTPGSSIASYFVITAYAANGESTELSVADSCFNSSGTPQGNIFGVDMPLFNFSVSPSDLKNNEAIYERFDISVSYNGTLVGGKDEYVMDEHVMIAYLISTTNPDKPWAYSILGWFTEPTDIIVQILDKESREIMETITVNVKYLADKQEYELEWKNLTTKFLEQKEAVSAHNYLMSYFVSRGYVTNYPEWFGGCYIEENKLHIKLASPSDEEISQILAPFDDVIVYENAEMSMSELQAYADKTAEELMENEYTVTSWYVDSITGNIIISVLEKDFEAVTKWINTAAENGNAPKIVIEIGEYIDLENQTIEFCAEPILENGAISWMYSINVKIDNGKIYLNEILYDQVSYVEDMKLDWGTPLSGNIRPEMMTEAIGKINSQKGCYILETTSESKYGKIAMYVIGDTYYFIRFYDNGQVMRVHSGTVQ